MLLYDLSHTSHSQARTGVQRVALELRRALKALPQELGEITYDPHRRIWRRLERWEEHALDTPPRAAKRRGAYWPLSAKLRGAWHRISASSSPPVEPLAAEHLAGFFTPEIFTARTGRMLGPLFRQLKCPRVALFHDAISLRLPDHAPASAVARFPAYLAELHTFDGVMAVSADSAASLVSYWDWAGWKNHPPVAVSSLGLDHLPRSHCAPKTKVPGELPVVLCVGSIEGRKNHLTLLNACEQLWAKGTQFKLRLIGTLQRETGRAAMERMISLQRDGRPIQYDGWLSDEKLQQAYSDCDFTVYASLLEGFGLPVWESLVRGRACICSAQGATGETAAGGGCLTMDSSSSANIAEAIRNLLQDGNLRERLSREAAERTPPTWRDCAQRLVDWLPALRRSKTN